MRVDTPFVHAAPGDSAQLECIVQGNPEPTVSEEGLEYMDELTMLLRHKTFLDCHG